MIYVKKMTRPLLILLCSAGIVPSLLQAAAYDSLSLAMKAGGKNAIENIVKKPQSQDRFKYDALDLQANPINNPERWGKAPLHEAASFFVGNPKTSNDTNYLNGVRWLLEALSSANKERILNQKSQDGATPLHIVAGYKKEDPNKSQKDRNQVAETVQAPIKRELSNDAYRFAGRLIEHKANLNEKDENGLTPLHWAVRHKNEHLVTMLLNKGADANIVDNYGKLPLHWAAIAGYTPIIELLLDKTNRNLINKIDKRGRTPLQWILRSREGAVAYEGGAKHMPKDTALENIKLLLKYGADPTIKDGEEHDAFHWANPEEEVLFNQHNYHSQAQQQQSMQPQSVAARQELLRQQQDDEKLAKRLQQQDLCIVFQ